MIGEIIYIVNTSEKYKNKLYYNKLKDIILTKHYAHRLPSISIAFGLIQKNKLIGICTIGKPASNSLCDGVCGVEHKGMVYELNRFYLNNDLQKNTASSFLGACLRRLDNIILVSYADSGMNHNGYIYQATNFLYTGSTKERTDKYTIDGKHSRHYNNDNINLRKLRTKKHRYIYFCFKSKKNRKKYKSLLNYNIEKYPKGENKNYKIGDCLKDTIINTSNQLDLFYENKHSKIKRCK